jgi:hypothetical protein
MIAVSIKIDAKNLRRELKPIEQQALYVGAKAPTPLKNSLFQQPAKE